MINSNIAYALIICDTDRNGIPYPADTIAHACGMNEGDSRY
jgi:hypothetical protein